MARVGCHGRGGSLRQGLEFTSRRGRCRWPAVGRATALAVSWLLLGVASDLSAAAQAAGKNDYDPARIGWRELRYRVSKFGISATSEIAIQPAGVKTDEAVRSGSRTAAEDQAVDAGELRLSMHTRAFQRHSELDLWLDSSSAAARRRVQLETGRRIKRNRYRHLRFDSTGVHSIVRRPTRDEIKLPHESWSQTSEAFIDYPAGCCAVVSTPAALFYVLSVADLSEPGDRVKIHLVSKSRVFLVELIAQRLTRVRADYRVEAAGESRHVEGPVEVLEIALTGREIEGRGDEKGFEFLGLHGDVRLLLDRNLGAAVQVIGAVRYLGRAHVKLQSVVLR